MSDAGMTVSSRRNVWFGLGIGGGQGTGRQVIIAGGTPVILFLLLLPTIPDA